MSSFRILSIYEAVNLDVLKKYGQTSAATDFAILLGCAVEDNKFINTKHSQKNRIAPCWTATNTRLDKNLAIDEVFIINENIKIGKTYNRHFGVRPVVPYSSIKEACQNEAIDNNGIKTVEYGEYPQTILNDWEEDYWQLETLLSNKTLKETGKTYTTDFAQGNINTFSPQKHIEYEKNGNKYLRFEIINDNNFSNLPNSKKPQLGDDYWLRVEPITWIVDEKEDIAIAKKVLFSGVPFQERRDNFYDELRGSSAYYNNDFNTTTLNNVLNNYFAKEIIPSQEMKLRSHETKESIKKLIKKPTR